MNNAPFYVGQKIVRVGPTKNSIDGTITVIKGNRYTCAGCFKCNKCGLWKVMLEEFHVIGKHKATCSCGRVAYDLGYYTGSAKYFAPVHDEYIDITAEIASEVKITDERPDKVLTPQTVNN